MRCQFLSYPTDAAADLEHNIWVGLPQFPSGIRGAPFSPVLTNSSSFSVPITFSFARATVSERFVQTAL